MIFKLLKLIPLIQAFLGEISDKRAARLNKRIEAYGGRVETLQGLRERFTTSAEQQSSFTMDKDEVQFCWKLAKKIR